MPRGNRADPKHWTTLESRKLQECRVFDVYQKTARSPHTGAAHSFFRIEADDWVNVVALTRDDELVMVRQYRHGNDEITLEIPGGIVDAGESPAQAAARELLEETGYRGSEPVPLGTVNPNPALFGNGCHTFLIREAARVAEIRNDGATEETVVELLPRSQLRTRLLAGEIGHALVIAGLFWFELSEGRERGRPR
jgi:8-oxo-dGTP pyrophosphatase MutT (NUDIX family)